MDAGRLCRGPGPGPSQDARREACRRRHLDPGHGDHRSGEEPARAATREVAEEAGIRCTALRLLEVRSLPPVIHPSGDHAQYLDLCFLCEADDEAEPYPADGENSEARWFPIDAPPPMNERFTAQLALAREDRPEARFRR
ncbi:NUDIX domain-containing protein [Brachybacterium sp. Z12]|uniref:NUDIX domain-containing protein n=1 Tax=Brachybacterium sp. Z12 TaxID=2759167 RepID=UPI00292A5A2D|nr:NUDIX domain-containing protein [Brachybacterium sp. Z12]